MRTTPEENERMGRWIGERLNQMDGPVRFLLPEGGVSALDAPGQPFRTPTPTPPCSARWSAPCARPANRQLIRVPKQHQRSRVRRRCCQRVPSPCTDAPARGGEW